MLYDKPEEILGKQKGTDNVIVMDFNAVVGEGKEDRVVGKFGLGKRNEEVKGSLNSARAKIL